VGLYRLFLTGPVDDPSCHCSRGSLYTERQVRKEREASPAIQRFRLYRTIANAEEWQCSEWLAMLDEQLLLQRGTRKFVHLLLTVQLLCGCVSLIWKMV
jgi:hypothetical protein